MLLEACKWAVFSDRKEQILCELLRQLTEGISETKLGQKESSRAFKPKYGIVLAAHVLLLFSKNAVSSVRSVFRSGSNSRDLVRGISRTKRNPKRSDACIEGVREQVRPNGDGPQLAASRHRLEE